MVVSLHCTWSKHYVRYQKKTSQVHTDTLHHERDIQVRSDSRSNINSSVKTTTPSCIIRYTGHEPFSGWLDYIWWRGGYKEDIDTNCSSRHLIYRCFWYSDHNCFHSQISNIAHHYIIKQHIIIELLEFRSKS